VNPPLPPGRLVRVLGAGVGLALGIGTTIGSGILRAPADVAQQLPEVHWIVAVWLGGGLYALLGALTMAEAATLVGRSGGFYPIARRGLGPYPAFVVGWLDFAAGAGSLAALALLVGDNTAVVVPACKGREVWIAAGLLVSFAMLQWRGVRAGGRVQIVLSALKALGFFLLVVGCVAASGSSQSAAAIPALPTPPLPHGAALLTAVAVALQGVIYTFDGWYSVIYIGEEVKEPKDIPRALFATVGAVTIIQLLVNFAFLAVLPIAVLGASKTPASDAAAVIVGGHADRAIAALVVLSLAGGMNAILFGTPRVLYAMARDRVVPSSLAATRENGTPGPALILTSLVALTFLWSGTFERVIASLSVLLVAMYASFFLAVIALRIREPNAVRPHKVIGYPVTTVLGLLFSLVFIGATVVGDPRSAEMGVVMLLVSVPAFFAQRRWLTQHPPSA
jgi:APA family basic amino acid/polyamine antiporter